jgi:hypothetical protein
LHYEPRPGSTNFVAFLYGPILLAGNLGTNNLPGVYTKKQTVLMRMRDPKVPVFVVSTKTFLKNIKSTKQPLAFQTKNLGQPNDATLVPFYLANHERYSIYWNIVSAANWKSNPDKISSTAESILQMALNEED